MGKDIKGKELGRNLYQRRDGIYEAKYTDAFGKRRSIYDKKLPALRKKLNEALYEKEHGIYNPDCEMSLNEWFDKWLDIFYKKKVKPVTYLRAIENYDRYIRISPLGYMKISDIKTIHIQKFANSLIDERKLKRSGIKPYLGIMGAALRKARECGYIDADPVKDIVLPKKNTKKRGSLTVREQELFFAYAEGSSYYDLFRFMILTGVRIGEAIALTWDDIDSENGIISVNKSVTEIKRSQKEIYEEMGYSAEKGRLVVVSSPKTEESSRRIPISAPCGKLLQNMRLRRREGVNLLFHTKNNTYLNHSNVNKRIKDICKDINEHSGEHINEFSAHTFRHTFATRCFEKGINPKTVQYLLGHASAETTMDIYTHISKEQAKKEIELADILDI